MNSNIDPHESIKMLANHTPTNSLLSNVALYNKINNHNKHNSIEATKQLIKNLSKPTDKTPLVASNSFNNNFTNNFANNGEIEEEIKSNYLDE